MSISLPFPRANGQAVRWVLPPLAKATIALATTIGLVATGVVTASPAHTAPEPGLKKDLPPMPWYVNDYPGMPTPFKGPLKIDVSRNNAQIIRAKNPDANPPGANDWNCRPTKKHPLPVVLVHGTTDRPAAAWNAGAPLFKNAGYCVFALSYGMLPGSTDGAVDKVENSAQQLADFVQKVLRATGAKKVNLVGHSQGGMMPFYYMNFLGGYKYVKNMAAISPSLRGVDGFGFFNIDPIRQMALNSDVVDLPPAQLAQIKGSEFLKKLHRRPLVHPSVNYTVIATKYDDVVTPYTSQLIPEGPNSHNVIIQDKCATNFTDHYANVFDPATLNVALQMFDPTYREEVPCGISVAFTGGYIPPQNAPSVENTAQAFASLPPAFQGPNPVVLSKSASQKAGLADKNAVPAGANYYDPKLAQRHPYPVLLVHGTFDNASSAWIGLAPLLRNAGFNVFTFNYGRPNEKSTAGGQTDMRGSAQELARMVQHVLRVTGAKKVDLVGHSQGGMMPHWYISKLGGGRYVHKLIGLGADNYGSIGAPFSKLMGVEDTTGSDQQAPWSDYMKELQQKDFLDPRVQYVMIGSLYDTMVVPPSSKWLPSRKNVTNVLLQSKYPTDMADHFAMPYDPYTLAEVVRFLDPRMAWEIPVGFVPFYEGGFIPLALSNR